MNTDDVDLNLLKIFDAIYTHRSVSRAADRLGLTQPTVSHGLARLRMLLHDRLFVRVRGGVEPTPAAERIAPALIDAVRAVQAVLDDTATFDPATSERVFRIHMSDLGEMVFLPPMLRRLRECAPGVAIETRQIESAVLAAALEGGVVDMAIGHMPALTGAFAHRHLFDEEYVTLRRAKAPRASASNRRATRRPTPDYIAVTSHPPTLAILRDSGLIDRVKLFVPHFLVVPSILAEVDYAVIVPRTVARAFRRDGIARIAALTGPGRHFDVGLFWTRRQGSEPGHAWLRSLIVELFEQPRAPTRSDRP